MTADGADADLPAYEGRDDLDPRLVPVRREFWVRELSDIRLQYAILDAWNAGASIADIARQARRSTTWVTTEIGDLVAEPPPYVEGRLGRRPMEVAYMYGVGEITRDQAIAELSTWPYEPRPVMGDVDEYEPDGPGSFQEVDYAYGRGLLSGQEYDAIGAGGSQNERRRDP